MQLDMEAVLATYVAADLLVPLAIGVRLGRPAVVDLAVAGSVSTGPTG